MFVFSQGTTNHFRKLHAHMSDIPCFNAIFLSSKQIVHALRLFEIYTASCSSSRLFGDGNIIPLQQIDDSQLACSMNRCLGNILPFHVHKTSTVNLTFHLHDAQLGNKLLYQFTHLRYVVRMCAVQVFYYGTRQLAKLIFKQVITHFQIISFIIPA